MNQKLLEIKITGQIADFDRIDNIYRTMARETPKLLDD